MDYWNINLAHGLGLGVRYSPLVPCMIKCNPPMHGTSAEETCHMYTVLIQWPLILTPQLCLQQCFSNFSLKRNPELLGGVSWALSKYFSAKDGSAPLEKIGPYVRLC